MTRIDRRFAKLAAEGRAAFVPYVMAGDPDRETSLEIIRGLPAADRHERRLGAKTACAGDVGERQQTWHSL